MLYFECKLTGGEIVIIQEIVGMNGENRGMAKITKKEHLIDRKYVETKQLRSAVENMIFVSGNVKKGYR